jgi:nucleoside 2-deoxyribosyltransferase
MSVYIAAALQYASKDKRVFYEEIGRTVKKFGLEPYIPHLHTANPDNPTTDPAYVRKKNMEALLKSKIIVADVSEPTTGTGMELERIITFNATNPNNRKPIICLAKDGVEVSWMVEGAALSGEIDYYIRYRDEDDALRKLENLLKRLLNESLNSAC